MSPPNRGEAPPLPASSPHPLRVDLARNIAVVTGAAGLIGAAIVRELSAAGARVVAVDRSQEGLAALVGAPPPTVGQVHTVVADLAHSPEIDRVFAEALRLGPLTILVNAVGLVANTWGDPIDFDDGRVDEILAVNLRAPLLCSLRAAAAMAPHRRGVIISLSSAGGSLRAHHRNAIYDTTKGGIDAMTRALATDLGPLGIRVNAVAPAATTGEPPEGRGHDLPLRRGGTPEDQAWAVLYLVSDAARFISGQIVYVDGGLMAQLRPPPATS